MKTFIIADDDMCWLFQAEYAEDIKEKYKEWANELEFTSFWEVLDLEEMKEPHLVDLDGNWDLNKELKKHEFK